MPLFPFYIEEFVTEKQAREITAPFWTDLTNIWSSAWKSWNSINEQNAHASEKRQWLSR